MNREAVQEFMFRFMEMATGAAVIGVVGVGDRTGLFGKMAGQGPLTLAQIVERTGLQERYLREGLRVPGRRAHPALRPAAGDLRAAGGARRLPRRRAQPVLPRRLDADDTRADARRARRRARCREGGGVPYSEFGEEMVAGIDRSNSPGMRILLDAPMAAGDARGGEAAEERHPRRRHRLRLGRASITMAKAYPSSTVFGYDVDPTSIARARAAPQRAEGRHQRPVRAGRRRGRCRRAAVRLRRRLRRRSTTP